MRRRIGTSKDVRGLLAWGSVVILGACANPEGDFEAAAQQNTVEAYREFLAAHPEHPLASEARERIRMIEEEAAWEEAQAANTIQAYQSFTDRYPDSNRAEEAAERQTSLRADAEWARVRDSDNPAALRSFLERFPQSEYAQEARRRLDEVMAAAEPPEPPPPPPEGDFQVQLAAFREEQTAETAAERLAEAHGEVLGDVELRVEPPAEGSSYYSVRTAGVDRAAADELCSELKAEGQDCLVVSRN